jgi:hypothetical protein
VFAFILVLIRNALKYIFLELFKHIVFILFLGLGGKVMSDEDNAMYSEKWHDLVNSTVDKFDELNW